MSWIRVATLSSLEKEGVTEVLVGDKPYAICRMGDEVTALDGTCPHVGGPIGQGRLEDGRIMCPWHCWEFDARTGVCTHLPSRSAAVFPVKIEGDDVLLDLPDA